MLEFAGEFETHVTVAALADLRLDALRQWGETRGLKCLHIMLSRGSAASQPMLTRRGRGVLSGELAQGQQLCHELRTAGFTATRLKIEAGIHNRDVPERDADALAAGAAHYFEHHVKMLLDARADVERLIAVAQRHGAHLSRNALRTRADGRQERFVTQRCHGVGVATAGSRLDALLAELSDGAILDVEREFVVYDSNEELDAGWLEARE